MAWQHRSPSGLEVVHLELELKGGLLLRKWSFSHISKVDILFLDQLCTAQLISHKRRLESLCVTLTFPLKITPLAKKLDCAVLGSTEEAYEKKTPYRRADHRGVEGRSVRSQCSGPVPGTASQMPHSISGGRNTPAWRSAT